MFKLNILSKQHYYSEVGSPVKKLYLFYIPFESPEIIYVLYMSYKDFEADALLFVF